MAMDGDLKEGEEKDSGAKGEEKGTMERRGKRKCERLSMRHPPTNKCSSLLLSNAFGCCLLDCMQKGGNRFLLFRLRKNAVRRCVQSLLHEKESEKNEFSLTPAAEDAFEWGNGASFKRSAYQETRSNID